MGCDIHAYMEYKPANAHDWRDFAGRINPGRHYGLFARLAGVRNYNDRTPIAQPRGLPDDVAWSTKVENQLYISEHEAEGNCTAERAARYVQQGCKYVAGHDGKNTWVTHPDWHSHSWVTVEEFEMVLADFPEEPEYHAILAALKSFETRGYRARLVFWFDN